MSMMLSKAAKLADHTYYNVIAEHVLNTFGEATEAEYQVNLPEEIVNRQSEYLFGISSATIDTTNIPIFIFGIQDTVAHPYAQQLGFESVTLQFTATGDKYTQFLHYVPSDATLVQPPTPPTTEGQEYYFFVYSWQHFLDMVNTALATAYAALLAAHGGVPTAAPYMTYDPISQLFTLWTLQTYATGNPNPAQAVKIYFNNALYNYFPNSFNTIFHGDSAENGPQTDYEFIIQDTHTNTPAAPAGYWFFTQEIKTLFAFWDAKRIVITSDIPTKNEYIPDISAAGTSTNSLNILQSFELPQNYNIRQSLLEFPHGEYRLSTIISDSGLKQINLKFWWATNFDELFPLFLNSHSQCFLSLLFRRKDYGNVTLPIAI